eukprot:21507-Eustigmatos_ZCMA.PRE.1
MPGDVDGDGEPDAVGELELHGADAHHLTVQVHYTYTAAEVEKQMHRHTGTHTDRYQNTGMSTSTDR